MFKLRVLFLIVITKYVLAQKIQEFGVGSGQNGNLRVCVVEGRGTYRRAGKFCPQLHQENSGIECVIGNDRLDCLRRMSKGTVDFGVFSPEDLIAAQWAGLDVLVTNELRNRPMDFERSIVALVNRRILPETISSAESILRNTTLCHPGHGNDQQSLSDTLTKYLESQVTEQSCVPELSLAENRIRATARYFAKACKAGPWVLDLKRDAELKSMYPSLCAACASQRCDTKDLYWGNSGALTCIAERAGDVTWARLDNVMDYFGMSGGTQYAPPDQYAFLCRDGSWQPIQNNTSPCVWLNRPWPVVVAKRKSAQAVSKLAWSLTNSSVTVDGHWKGSLAALLEINQALTAPLQPQQAPLDYLSKARGFREAYSQSGCNPPRHISICTTSVLEKNKCEWLSEAGLVYGVQPPMQCALRKTKGECFNSVSAKEIDVLIAPADWLITAQRDYSVSPILYETTPIIEYMNTVVAYVRRDSGIANMADLRGKRAAFPLFDGVAWHSLMLYLLKTNQIEDCNLDKITDYFGDSCAPGIESVQGLSEKVIKKFSRNCYEKDGIIMEGEKEALRSLVEQKTDVAFINMRTYREYVDRLITAPWAANVSEVVPICPEDSQKFCFLSWSSLGQIYASKTITTMKHQEILNAFKKLDQLFGKYYPFHTAMFSMYGTFNHQYDVLFHNNTRSLVTSEQLELPPYNRASMMFERSISSYNFENCSHSSTISLTSVFSLVLAALVFHILS